MYALEHASLYSVDIFSSKADKQIKKYTYVNALDWQISQVFKFPYQLLLHLHHISQFCMLYISCVMDCTIQDLYFLIFLFLTVDLNICAYFNSKALINYCEIINYYHVTYTLKGQKTGTPAYCCAQPQVCRSAIT